MKKIRRPPAPEWLKKEYKAWNKQLAETGKFDMPDSTYRALVNELAKMTQHHCSFCDVYLLGGQYVIEHFKPKSKFPSEAFEWKNLYLCCQKCNVAKGDKFDERLLRPDMPNYDFNKYFGIDFKSGKILPNRHENKKDQERAEITIDYFKFNDFERPFSRLKELEKYKGEQKGYNKSNSNYYSYRFFIDNSFEIDHTVIEDGDEITVWFAPIVKHVYIESMTINNIKCFENIEINFNPSDKTSLIIGTNARGKSTILQLIALGLCGIKKVPFPYNWKKVVKTGTNKGIFEIVFKINSKSEKDFFKFEINENDEINLTDSSFAMAENLGFLLSGYGASRHIKLEEPSPYKEIEPVATLFGENGYLKHIKISENYKYISENFDLIKPLINAILDKADKLHKIRLEDYDTNSLYFRTPSNLHTVYFKKQPGHDNLIIDTLIPVEALSEGFKSTLVWLLDMIIRIVQQGGNIANADKVPGIVLIDEVDLHLHPSWQRTILPSLEQTFPNIQFIVTTHSPFVVQSAIGRNVIVLDFDDKTGSVKAVHKEISSELSYRAVVREIFDIQSPFSYETELEMNKFYEMRDKILKKEKVNEKKFKQIVMKLAEKGVEIEGVMRREIRDLERITGRKFDL